MKTVVLDYPTDTEQCATWIDLERVTMVERYSRTTLPELLERARTADVLVTWEMPLRREVLDYITRPRVIIVPHGRRDALVELPIATQLGLSVYEFAHDPDVTCSWITSVADLLAGSD